MDREILVQYADMIEEVKDIRKRIEKLGKEVEKLNRKTPDSERKAAALTRWQKTLELKEIELLEFTCQVEEYIETIQTSELRIMFRLYYIDLLPWWKVAQQMNRMFPKRKYTEDSCRIRHARFFEKV